MQNQGLNLGELMKQAQAIQQSFEANKEQLKKETATATVGAKKLKSQKNSSKKATWRRLKIWS